MWIFQILLDTDRAKPRKICREIVQVQGFECNFRIDFDPMCKPYVSHAYDKGQKDSSGHTA